MPLPWLLLSGAFELCHLQYESEEPFGAGEELPRGETSSGPPGPAVLTS